MKKLFSLVMLIGLCSCATSDFFGARVIGPYWHHFQGHLKCARIEGLFNETKCGCLINDPQFNKTSASFLVAPTPIWCEQTIEETF